MAQSYSPKLAGDVWDELVGLQSRLRDAVRRGTLTAASDGGCPRSSQATW